MAKKKEYPYVEDYKNASGSKSWRIYYLGANGERKTKNTGNPRVRDDFLAEQRKVEGLKQVGVKAKVVPFTDAEVSACNTALDLLQSAGFYRRGDDACALQVVKFAQWFIKHYHDDAVAIPKVKEAVELFLQSRLHVDKDFQKGYKNTFSRFEKLVKGKYVNHINAEVVDHFIYHLPAHQTYSDTSRRHLYNHLNAFIEFCRGKDNPAGAWITKSPMKHVRTPAWNKHTRLIYTLDEVKSLIQASLDLDHAGLFIFRLFSMIRTREFRRMVHSSEETNAALDFVNRSTNTIYLPAEIVKHTGTSKHARPRTITLMPVLAEWMDYFQSAGIKIRTDTKLEQVVRKRGVPNKSGKGFSNLLRHTAVSYRVAIEDRLSTVAIEAGNSEDVIMNHYYSRVSEQDAMEFFDLTPDKFRLPHEKPVVVKFESA